VIEGLRDGTIDCIATDHAPHSVAEKELEFGNAPFGMTGLETALALVAMELVNKEKFTWLDVLAKLTQNPARVIREHLGVVKPASVADLVLIDPEKKWRLTPERIRSRSKNTPWLNKDLTGCVHTTIVGGEVKYSAE
jgi:dihydroorotase